MKLPDISISTLGGNCPVQGEGTINGVPFYFRARWESWSLSIGEDPLARTAWRYEGIHPDAGWLDEGTALGLLESAALLYAQGYPGD